MSAIMTLSCSNGKKKDNVLTFLQDANKSLELCMTESQDTSQQVRLAAQNKALAIYNQMDSIIHNSPDGDEKLYDEKIRLIDGVHEKMDYIRYRFIVELGEHTFFYKDITFGDDIFFLAFSFDTEGKCEYISIEYPKNATKNLKTTYYDRKSDGSVNMETGSSDLWVSEVKDRTDEQPTLIEVDPTHFHKFMMRRFIELYYEESTSEGTLQNAFTLDLTHFHLQYEECFMN